MSISLAHKQELASVRVRHLRHTCDVIRVVSRASSSANMSALSMKMDSSTSSLSLKIGEDGDVDNIFERALSVGDGNRLGGQPFYKGPVAHVGCGLLWREGNELLFCKDNVFIKTTSFTS